jgi:hypothetical protein
MEEEKRIFHLIPYTGPAETRVKKNVGDQTLLSFEVPGLVIGNS